MPFIKSPTSQDNLGNDAVEGGLILPFAFDLPKGWSVGMMTELDLMQDSSGHDYHPEFVNSVTLGHALFGKLNGYAEFFSSVSTEADSSWIGMVDFGLTYGLTDNFQLDAGVNIGVTSAADDVVPFVGLSHRF